MMGNKIKSALIVVAIVLVLAFVAEFFMSACFPEYLFNGHLVVPVYFGLFYLVTLLLMPSKMSGKEFFKFFIGFKAVKIFLSMSFIVVLAFVWREQVLALVFNFLVYYLLMLVPECLYGVYCKKHIK